MSRVESHTVPDGTVLAGQDAGPGSGMGAVLLCHLDATQRSDHERLGVIGVTFQALRSARWRSRRTC